MFFGGINGFNAFFPEKIKDNLHVPPILITSFHKLNKEFYFDRPVSEVKEITLSHRDFTFHNLRVDSGLHSIKQGSCLRHVRLASPTHGPIRFDSFNSGSQKAIKWRISQPFPCNTWELR